MRPCNPGKAFKTILFIESILVFSIISGFLISLLLTLWGSPEQGGTNHPGNRQFWLQNHRILLHFMNDTPSGRDESNTKRPDPPEKILSRYRALIDSGQNDGPSTPLIREFLELKTIEIQVNKSPPARLKRTVFTSPSGYSFVDKQKKRLELKYLHSRKQYARVVDAHRQTPPENKEMKILYLDSLVRNGQNQMAFSLFKDLFRKSHLSAFRMIPAPLLNRLITSLDDEFWYEKLQYLAQKNAFWEIYREKKYIKSTELAALFNAQYQFQRRRYTRANSLLNRVKSDKLGDYKNYLRTMIRLRKAGKDPNIRILAEIDRSKSSPRLHADLLLNAANLFLVRGRLGQAHTLYQRYVGISQDTDHPDYWKALWVSAWIQIKKNQKKLALAYFKKGKDSPVLPYRIANLYWTSQFKKKFSRQIKQYPFSYYYTRLDTPPSFLTRETLKRFITLINGNQSASFLEVISALKFLVKNNLTDDALDLIKLAKPKPQLSNSDRNMLKIIESIIYLKKNNHYRAFIQFKRNFPRYECFYLPQFLSEIYLPIQYEHLIRKYSQENDLDPYLVLALIREESFFRSDAVSPARACGLMQLLFRTARQVSRKTGGRLARSDLFTPAINIRLGTRYLKSLFDKYNGETHLALAAYNAGDRRVDQWIEKFGDVPENQFIEMIPFTQTRTYVKNIYRNHYFYRFYNLKSRTLGGP